MSLNDPLERLGRGELPANVALMQVLIDSRDMAQARSTIKAALSRAEPESVAHPRLRDALDLLDANPGAFDLIKAILSRVDHHDGPGLSVDRLARAFDEAAALSPAGGSALYALGSPDLMTAATAEVVAHMRGLDLLGGHRRLLEVGCGSGRLLRALAPDFEFLVGLDISIGMAAAAQAQIRGLANVAVVRNSGDGLGSIADKSVHVVLFADSFPYVTQLGAGLAAHYMGECARVLRPGGRLLILNLRYGSDLEADRDALVQWAEGTDLRLARVGEAEFQLWDAPSFLLHRP